MGTRALNRFPSGSGAEGAGTQAVPHLQGLRTVVALHNVEWLRLGTASNK